MKWIGLTLVGGALVLSVRALRRAFRSRHVSGSWLEESFRRGLYNQYDGPCWSWPVNKIANEHGWRNRTRLRKSA